MATITSERVELGAEVEDWTEAIRRSAAPLVRDGSITPEYVEAIFDSFATNGGYMIVVPGVVLAHARPERGAARTAMSVLTLRDPVPYADDPTRPLSVVLTFAAVDADEHVTLLQHLAQVLVDPEALAVLRSTRDVQAVLALLAAG